MGGTPGRHLGRMGDHQHLRGIGQTRQPLAHRMGRGPTDAPVDLVEDQGGRGAGARQHHLQRQHEARQLAAGGDLDQRAERRAGVGRHLEGHPLAALAGPGARVERLQPGLKARLVQLQRRQLARHRLGQPVGRRPACLGQGGDIVGQGGLGGVHRALGGGHVAAAVLDRAELGGDLVLQRGQGVDAAAMLARQGTQREQPFLQPLQAGRVVLHRPARLFQGRQPFGGLDGGTVQRFDGRRQTLADLVLQPLQPAQHAAQGGIDAAVGGQRTVDLVQFAGGPLALHHGRARVGQAGFLAGLGVQRGQFVQRVAQIGLVGLRAAVGGLDLVQRRPGGGQGGMAAPGARGQRVVAAEGVEQSAVGGGVQQSTVVVLAMDFDQRLAQLPQQPDADRLIVGERPAAAVGGDDAAQDQRGVRLQAVFVQQGDGRVVVAHIEGGDDHALVGGRPHQRAVGPGAQRQAERVQQDRLARTGLAGQHVEAGLQRQRQPVDQDDIADGQADQHGPRRPLMAQPSDDALLWPPSGPLSWRAVSPEPLSGARSRSSSRL